MIGNIFVGKRGNWFLGELLCNKGYLVLVLHHYRAIKSKYGSMSTDDMRVECGSIEIINGIIYAMVHIELVGNNFNARRVEFEKQRKVKEEYAENKRG